MRPAAMRTIFVPLDELAPLDASTSSGVTAATLSRGPPGCAGTRNVDAHPPATNATMKIASEFESVVRKLTRPS